MSTRKLIDAIHDGDSINIQAAFESAMASRIAERLDDMRRQVARNMFKEAVSSDSKHTKVGDNHIHVSDAGNGKYKVHAVGKNFAHGIKVGEHLTDTDLDDFTELGGKIKRVKHTTEQVDVEEAANNQSKPTKVGDNHIHVSDAGNGKYKVHAVGKNFADGIKVGEHLTDTELDDFTELGGKIKRVKQ
jgi:hypothetical protein